MRHPGYLAGDMESSGEFIQKFDDVPERVEVTVTSY